MHARAGATTTLQGDSESIMGFLSLYTREVAAHPQVSNASKMGVSVLFGELRAVFHCSKVLP
jgi:hypothetical protein